MYSRKAAGAQNDTESKKSVGNWSKSDMDYKKNVVDYPNYYEGRYSLT